MTSKKKGKMNHSQVCIPRAGIRPFTPFDTTPGGPQAELSIGKMVGQPSSG